MGLESYVFGELARHGIEFYEDLTIKNISNSFKIEILLWEQQSRIYRVRNNYFIILDKRQNKVVQYEEFLHEFAHYLLEIYDIRDYDYKELKIQNIVKILKCPKNYIENTDCSYCLSY